jgi:hypothetical protein
VGWRVRGLNHSRDKRLIFLQKSCLLLGPPSFLFFEYLSYSPGIKWLVHEADRSSPFGPEVRNEQGKVPLRHMSPERVYIYFLKKLATSSYTQPTQNSPLSPNVALRTFFILSCHANNWSSNQSMKRPSCVM